MAHNGTFKTHEVAHHFGSSGQEFDTAKIGMWVFLIQEILFFSALFVAYAFMRYLYPGMLMEAHYHLSWEMGAINTVFLITSSFTMVMAVRAAQTSMMSAMLKYLVVTTILACCFMGVKYVEYDSKFKHGYFPPKVMEMSQKLIEYNKTVVSPEDKKMIHVPLFGRYEPVEVSAMHPQLPMFFGLYFLMTGLHGLHVVIGIGLIIWLIIRGRRGEFYSGFFTPVEMVGLYWHLVDLVWIFLFPLLYLIG